MSTFDSLYFEWRCVSTKEIIKLKNLIDENEFNLIISPVPPHIRQDIEGLISIFRRKLSEYQDTATRIKADPSSPWSRKEMQIWLDNFSRMKK